jgi:hypothetical protein
MAEGEIDHDEAIACDSGARAPLPSSAILLVRLAPVQAHYEAGRPTAAAKDLPRDEGARY